MWVVLSDASACARDGYDDDGDAGARMQRRRSVNCDIEVTLLANSRARRFDAFNYAGRVFREN